MWERIKQGFRNFMAGRHGADQLSTALVWLGLLLYILGLIFGLGIFTLLGTAAYIVALFRMMSRNNDQRNVENSKYVHWLQRVKRSFQQARSRFQNRKEYKYFRCPQCKSWIRLKRNTGQVTVTCGHCHNKFSQSA